MRIMRSVLVVAFMLWWLPALVVAEEPRYQQVHFQVERSQQVGNDQMQVWLSAQAEGSDPARIARTINETMDWALALGAGREGMRLKTGNYRTQALRDKDKLRGWQVSQDLHIEGTDIPAISALVGELQERLQVRSMGFSVSAEARRDAEEQLIEAALLAFQERAAHVRRIMGAKDHRLVNASIQAGGHFPGPVLRAQVASAEMSAPAVQAGESEVRVMVSGSIELIMP
jgi:predicted secreted protein